jgi:hypothetical protein
MKLIKNDDGFTLIEILVTINLTVIAVTFIVSFYLFASKFINAATTKFERDQKTAQFTYNLQNFISKSNGFNILINQKTVLLTLENGKKIIFADSIISLDDYYKLTKVHQFGFSILLESGETILVNSNPPDSTEENNIIAGQITNMKISIICNGKEYDVLYNKPMISTLRFTNINEFPLLQNSFTF